MQYIVEKYTPRIGNINDYIEFITFQVPPAHEFEEFQRWALNYSYDLAIYLGDGKLQWVYTVAFENFHALLRMDRPDSPFKLLFALRESVPEPQRSDSTLTARAIRMLLSDEIQKMAYDTARYELNNDILSVVITTNPLREAEPIEPPDVVIIKENTLRIQKDILRYLAARSSRNPLHATPEEFNSLSKIALEAGYSLHLNEAASTSPKNLVQFTIKKIPLPSRQSIWRRVCSFLLTEPRGSH